MTVKAGGPYFTRRWRGEQRAEALARAGYRCQWPGCTDMGSDGRGRRLHQAHLTPHEAGGDDTATVILCAGHHRQFDAAAKRREASRW